MVNSYVLRVSRHSHNHTVYGHFCG